MKDFTKIIKIALSVIVTVVKSRKQTLLVIHWANVLHGLSAPLQCLSPWFIGHPLAIAILYAAIFLINAYRDVYLKSR